LSSRGLQPHGKGAYRIYFSISIISVYTLLKAIPRATRQAQTRVNVSENC